jgi:hypothetical protein
MTFHLSAWTPRAFLEFSDVAASLKTGPPHADGREGSKKTNLLDSPAGEVFKGQV